MKRGLAAGVAAVAVSVALHLDALAVWSVSTINPSSLATATLAAPTNFAAAAGASPVRVILSWTPPPPANQGYQTSITRLDTSAWTTTTLIAPGGATSGYVDSTVLKGVQYCYLPATVAGPWSAQAPFSAGRCVTP